MTATNELRMDANDGTLEELEAAQHNFNLLRGGWCNGHGGETTQDVYFRDGVTGSHGWMFSGAIQMVSNVQRLAKTACPNAQCA